MLRVSLILLAVFAVLGIVVMQLEKSNSPITNSLRVADAMSSSDTVGYSRAVEPIEFSFPRDHGPHPDFKTEWWYYTGNLDSKSGRQFGYQFTIFRIALTPTPEERQSDWAASQMYMAHFALSDIDGNEFYNFERFSRGAQELAGAQAAPFRVWLEDWEAVDEKDSKPLFPVHRLRARQDGVSIDFRLESTKPLVFQGENGLSQKSWERGNASYYYSMTRLKTDGTITIGDEVFDISGLSWKDREWSTSALAENQIGWDWFSLQLSNGEEVMYFTLRNRDKSLKAFDKGALVFKNGESKLIKPGSATLTEKAYWTSPDGGTYPSKWNLQIPTESINLDIASNMPDQELDVSVRYWEGSVSISGTRGSDNVTGRGYVEMTGYGEN